MNVQNLRKRVTRSLSRIEAQEKQMKKRAKLHYDEKSNNGLESATKCYKDSSLAGKEVMKCDKISNADQKLTTKKNSTTSESISQSVSSIGKRSRKIKSNEEEEEGNEETHNEAAKAPVTATATATATKEKQVILRKSSIRRTKKKQWSFFFFFVGSIDCKSANTSTSTSYNCFGRKTSNSSKKQHPQ
jgi:ATP-dependent Clp protease ATP-binding subunit ClpA